MGLVMQVLIQNIAIAQSKDNKMTASGYSFINEVKQLKNVSFELCRFGHTVEALLTNVVANQL